MNCSKTYTLCGFWDFNVECDGETSPSKASYLPTPIFTDDIYTYIPIANEEGKIERFKEFDENRAGVFAKFESNITKSIGDKYLYGFCLNEKVYFGDKEAVMGIIVAHRHILDKKSKTDERPYNYLETLMFVRKYDEFEKKTREFEENSDNILMLNLNLKMAPIQKEKDLKEKLNVNNSKQVYFYDAKKIIPNMHKLNEKIFTHYFYPSYILKLSNKHPEYFEK